MRNCLIIRRVDAGLLCLMGHLVGCASSDPTDTVQQAAAALSTPSEPEPPVASPLNGHCFRLSVGDRYLDAYTVTQGDVVTRTYQNNDTQQWCFTQLSGMDVFAIQHRSFSGQFLDAYIGSQGNKAVLRNRQQDGSQDWQVEYDGLVHRIEQVATGRHLEARQVAAEDYRVVMRTPWETAWGQRWQISPL